MALHASSWRFILPPAVDPAPFTADINAALESFKAFLDAAVANPPDYTVFRVASEIFHQRSDELATQLRIADADNPDFFRDAWWFNLSAIGLGAAGITAENVREQLDGLPGHAELSSRLALRPDQGCDNDEFTEKVARAVSNVLEECWWFLSDTTLSGIRVQSNVVQERNAVDLSCGAGLMFSVLNRDFPLVNTGNENDGRHVWRFNIYRLALQLLDYQSTS